MKYTTVNSPFVGAAQYRPMAVLQLLCFQPWLKTLCSRRMKKNNVRIMAGAVVKLFFDDQKMLFFDVFEILQNQHFLAVFAFS